MHRAEFVKLDDRTVSPGNKKLCGKKCTQHKFEVKSDGAKQRVWVAAFVDDSKQLPDECQTNKKKHPHVFGPDPRNNFYTWFDGQI